MKSHSFVALAFYVLAGVVGASLPSARADDFDSYVPSGQFNLPAGPIGTEWVHDVLGDGRIITLLNTPVDAEVYLETSVSSRAFTLHGTLSGAPSSFNVTFIRVSPDGTNFAVGTFDQVGVCPINSLACTWFVAGHFDGEWYDNTHLLLTQSIGNSVTVLDTASPDPGNPVNPSIIENTDDFGAGVVLDDDGNLFVGAAVFGPGGFEGPVRFFENATWTAALKNGPPLDFTDGTLIVDIPTGVSLGFDQEGNLHVGGGGGFVGLVRRSAVLGAQQGMGPADPDNPSQVRRFNPVLCFPGSDFYVPSYNAITRELYIFSYVGSGCAPTVLVFAVPRPVPAISEWGTLIMLLLFLTVGTLLVGRSAPTSAAIGER